MIELLERLGYRPRTCVWELTLACDMRCLHCGSLAGSRRADELTTDEALRLADELVALGCRRVTLAGGEPTLRADWHLIARHLVESGAQVNIISNGWTFGDESARLASEAGLSSFGFSLDGFEDAHDRVRRRGSFERVVRAFDICRSEGLRTSVVTHVNRLNRRRLPELRHFLGEHGVAAWQLQLGNPSGAMRENRDLVIEPEELLWLIPEIAALCQDASSGPIVHPGDNLGYYGVCESALRDRGSKPGFWIGCLAGCRVVGIESNGNVKGCLSMPSARHGAGDFVEGNVRDTPLSELWLSPRSFAYNRAFETATLGGFCAVCRFGDICRGGCAWTAYSHSGGRHDNPYCFYRQAVIAGREDLLGDDAIPTEAEQAWLSEQG